MRADAQIVFLRLIGGGGGQFRRQTWRTPATIIDPDFDRVNLARRLLAYRLTNFCFGADFIGDAFVGHRARPRIRRTDAASGHQHARAAELARRLLVAHLYRQIAVLDALRHHHADAVIQGKIQIVEDDFTRVIGRAVAQALLKPRMHMRADQRGHHGFAGDIHARHAGRGGDFTLFAHARNHAALDQKGRRFDGRGAITCNQPRAFVQLRQRRRARCREHQYRQPFQCRPNHGISSCDVRPV